jgi:hypothetical protein
VIDGSTAKMVCHSCLASTRSRGSITPPRSDQGRYTSTEAVTDDCRYFGS